MLDSAMSSTPNHQATTPPRLGAALYALYYLAIPLGRSTRKPSLVDLPTHPEITVHRDAAVDLYLPENPNGGSVILVHGGGFVVGSRKMKPVRHLATLLAEAGLATVAVGYRMVGSGGVPAGLEDVAAAMRWWQANAPRHGLSPDAIHLLGFSAGSAMGLLAASATPDVSLKSAACLYGLYDWSALSGGPAGWLRGQLPGAETPAGARASSPIEAGQLSCPLLLIHGTEDHLTPVDQAHAMARQREDLGLPTRTQILEGAGHGFFNRASNSFVAPAIEEMVAFFQSPAP